MQHSDKGCQHVVVIASFSFLISVRCPGVTRPRWGGFPGGLQGFLSFGLFFCRVEVDLLPFANGLRFKHHGI